MARDGLEGGGGPRISAGFVVLAIFVVLLVTFIFQNTETAQVKLFLWQYDGPMWIVLLGTALVTLVLAEVSTLLRRRRR